MKTIGLLGGMSWESTVSYYQIINSTINQRLGGLHSAQCLLYSVDFQTIEACQATGQWEESGRILAEAACALERGGADFILICTNTMHKVFEQVQASVSIPLLHIADATIDAVREKALTKVGLLGTAYTMEQNFYKDKLLAAGLEICIPEQTQRKEINRIIFQELCKGHICETSRHYFQNVVAHMADQHCQGIILGCTEIGLLLPEGSTDMLLFDTAKIHALYAVACALKHFNFEMR